MPTSYHFDFGNSTDGPIGFCARVVADSREEALEELRDRLQSLGDEMELRWAGCGDAYHEEYITVYFGVDNLTVNDIDDEEAADDEGGEDDDQDDQDGDEPDSGDLTTAHHQIELARLLDAKVAYARRAYQSTDDANLRADIRRIQSWARRNPVCASDPHDLSMLELRAMIEERDHRKAAAHA